MQLSKFGGLTVILLQKNKKPKQIYIWHSARGLVVMNADCNNDDAWIESGCRQEKDKNQ